jgi:hypothetical protein
MNAPEPELITIVEGPSPAFHPAPEDWVFGLVEGPRAGVPSRSRMRTFSGPKMVERCRRAWGAGRPVVLDFPDGIGLRKQVEVIAARWEELPEGHVLDLWVRATSPS